jgi:hypothetical protein
MYSRIAIKNFRGIESLEAEGLRRINLIVGRNNSGKTTFLEGVFLLGGATNTLFPTTIGQLRGQRLEATYPDPLWRPLFHDLDPSMTYLDSTKTASAGEGGISVGGQDMAVKVLSLHYKDSEGKESNLHSGIDFKTRTIHNEVRHRDDVVPTVFVPARSIAGPAHVAQQFSSLLKTKQDRDAMEALRIIEPAVQRIEVLSEPSGPSIYLDIGLEALVPLAVCGEGMVRLFSIILDLVASRNGVLLIDEIDNGLHYSVMPMLWNVLGALIEKHQVQVFGTTHNDDIIRSALEAFAGKEGMLGLFRIDKRGDRHVMVAYSDEAMQGVREVPFEVRG